MKGLQHLLAYSMYFLILDVGLLTTYFLFFLSMGVFIEPIWGQSTLCATKTSLHQLSSPFSLNFNSIYLLFTLNIKKINFNIILLVIILRFSFDLLPKFALGHLQLLLLGYFHCRLPLVLYLFICLCAFSFGTCILFFDL